MNRLPPDEWYPAGVPGISARRVQLPDGTHLRVVEAGEETSPPIVLLHGWAVSAYLWRHTIPALAAAGWRVHVPDLPGHGLSDAPLARGGYSLTTFADRIAAFLDTLGAAALPIVAQSMAGRIGLELARRGRAERLALFGPVGFGDINPARAFAPFIPSLPGDLPSLLVPRRVVEVVQRRVHGKLGWFTERDIDEYWAPTQFPNVMRAQLQMLREFDWAPVAEPLLAALALPALVVFGTQDRTVKPVHAERLVKLLPRGNLVWIEGGGHVVMEEAPDHTNALLVEFLRRAA